MSPSLQQLGLNYPGWEADKAAAEKIFVEHSLYDVLMQEKIIGMRRKQRLHETGDDRSQIPHLHTLDSTMFTYQGWQTDKEDAEKRLVGDCSVLQLGSYHNKYNQMKKKESLSSGDRSNIDCLREMDNTHLSYPGWQRDVEIAEQIYVQYVTPVRFYEKLHAMQNKQRLMEGDRSHPDIAAMDKARFTYQGWEVDQKELMDRHTGDCTLFQLGITCSFLFSKMQKKQQMHEDRASIPVLKSLDDYQFTYLGWETDKQTAEGYFTDFSTLDRFQDKVVAMRNKQKLLVDGDRSHPDLVALDSVQFTYPGWHQDTQSLEKRHTGDCTVLQLGSFHSTFKKMKKKQKLFETRGTGNTCSSSLEPTVNDRIMALVEQQQTGPGDDDDLDKRDKKCVVCLEKEPVCAFIPCGHLCVCSGCVPCFERAAEAKSGELTCPLCRKSAISVTRIFA
ncbi:expressed unknown protein [Seminavis robusta]|uniref:RING-type domain-containing protein n=1 Tax=Seminavis robusta TaxID=568900 RepID=A0A9N8EZX5_9STRA|nr:expressed unknown protein [Seminavis robusta]|eukprot:Sro2496_g329320.1 n/a (447) ;mRNA; f:6940-8280